MPIVHSLKIEDTSWGLITFYCCSKTARLQTIIKRVQLPLQSQTLAIQNATAVHLGSADNCSTFHCQFMFSSRIGKTKAVKSKPY